METFAGLTVCIECVLCVSQFYLNQHGFLSIIIVQFLLWVEKCIAKFSCEVICFCKCKTAKVLVIVILSVGDVCSFYCIC